MRRWTLSVLIFSAAGGSAHAAELRVESGPLRAVVRDAPWSITFEQRGGEDLRTHPSWAPRNVRVEPAVEGVIAVEVVGAAGAEATAIPFVTQPGERLFGTGERSDAVD